LFSENILDRFSPEAEHGRNNHENIDAFQTYEDQE
jgi:hypothetical protein